MLQKDWYPLSYRLKCLTTIILCLICSGCYTPTIKLSQESLSSIKTIEVIKPPKIKSYYFGSCCGIHGISHSAHNRRRDAKFVDPENKIGRLKRTLRNLNLKVPLSLAKNTAANLSNAGFQTSVDWVAWDLSGNKPRIRYSDIRSSADAVLLLELISFSFESNQYSGPYRLDLWVTATLFDTKTKKILYRGHHTFGSKPVKKGWRHTPSTVTYDDFNQISGNPEQVTNHIAEGISGIASTIASDLSF